MIRVLRGGLANVRRISALGRLVKSLGALDAATMRRVDDALKISLGLSDL